MARVRFSRRQVKVAGAVISGAGGIIGLASKGVGNADHTASLVLGIFESVLTILSVMVLCVMRFLPVAISTT